MKMVKQISKNFILYGVIALTIISIGLSLFMFNAIVANASDSLSFTYDDIAKGLSNDNVVKVYKFGKVWDVVGLRTNDGKYNNGVGIRSDRDTATLLLDSDSYDPKYSSRLTESVLAFHYLDLPSSKAINDMYKDMSMVHDMSSIVPRTVFNFQYAPSKSIFVDQTPQFEDVEVPMSTIYTTEFNQLPNSIKSFPDGYWLTSVHFKPREFTDYFAYQGAVESNGKLNHHGTNDNESNEGVRFHAVENGQCSFWLPKTAADYFLGSEGEWYCAKYRQQQNLKWAARPVVQIRLDALPSMRYDKNDLEKEQNMVRQDVQRFLEKASPIRYDLDNATRCIHDNSSAQYKCATQHLETADMSKYSGELIKPNTPEAISRAEEILLSIPEQAADLELEYSRYENIVAEGKAYGLDGTDYDIEGLYNNVQLATEDDYNELSKEIKEIDPSFESLQLDLKTVKTTKGISLSEEGAERDDVRDLAVTQSEYVQNLKEIFDKDELDMKKMLESATIFDPFGDSTSKKNEAKKTFDDMKKIENEISSIRVNIESILTIDSFYEDEVVKEQFVIVNNIYMHVKTANDNIEKQLLIFDYD